MAEYNISPEVLDKWFDAFVTFIESKDNKPFRNLQDSKFLEIHEGYKQTLWDQAKSTLEIKFWEPEDIDSGQIHKQTVDAMKVSISPKYAVTQNNLIDWRSIDAFTKQKRKKPLEKALFDHFKSKTKEHISFERFLDLKIDYRTIAYLFFLKNPDKFLPIAQSTFDRIFSLLEISGFTTSGNASWENYQTFNGILKQVKDYLGKRQQKKVTSIDAHNFLWTIGRHMGEEAYPKPMLSPSSSIGNEISAHTPSISEEDDEESFPEGKEKFRLHRTKERSQSLVKRKKEKVLEEQGELHCEVCGFSFFEKYGELGQGFIEAHHLYPISALTEETETLLEDLALVCSNCHRMLHRRRPWINLESLKSLIET